MLWLTGLVLLVGTAPLLGRTAILGCASGGTLTGHVRLTDRGILVVNAEQDSWREVPLTNLAWAYFDNSNSSVSAATLDGLPSPWLETDIGRVTLHGSACQRGDGLLVGSSGLGVRVGADSLHYVYCRVEGDAEVGVQVASAHRTHPLAMVGLMARESLAPESRHVTIGVTASGRGVLSWRDEPGGEARLQPLGGWRVPCWLRLKREGDLFSVYHSPNGIQWRLIEKRPVRMNPAYNLGLASASGAEWVMNWTAFAHLEMGRQLANSLFPPRAELTSGSVVVGCPISTPGAVLDMRWAQGSFSIPSRAIARLLFQWAAPGWWARLPHDQAGVWLASGEFLEGDFRDVGPGKLRVSSVLYGLQTLDTTGEVLMMAFRSSALPAAHFQVTTVNGSTFRAITLRPGDNELILQEPALGPVTIPLPHLASITRL
jgi:hypothetical protein